MVIKILKFQIYQELYLLYVTMITIYITGTPAQVRATKQTEEISGHQARSSVKVSQEIGRREEKILPTISRQNNINNDHIIIICLCHVISS